jgi:Rad3-related DNA helicase
MSEQDSKADLILLLHHNYVNERLKLPDSEAEIRVTEISRSIFDESKHLAEECKALERQLGEVVAERDAADDLLQSMELSYSALREECTTLRQSLQRAEARRKAEVTANMVGGIQVEDGDKYAGADNLAIVLASYFERHMDRPEPDPEGENGWGEWAEAKARKAMQIIADEINKAREPLTHRPRAQGLLLRRH